LEMDAIHEEVLGAYLAAVHGMPAATLEELRQVDKQVLGAVPPALIAAERFLPLQIHGGGMVVALAESDPDKRVRRLGVQLGRKIYPRITTDFRLSTLLARYYGIEMPPRFLRLAEKLQARRSTPRLPRISHAPRSGVASGPTPSGGKLPTGERKQGGSVKQMSAASAAVATASGDPTLSWQLSCSPETALGPDPAIVAQALQRADTRDRVLQTLGEFALHCFDFVAVFVVQGEIASGRQAFGAACDREHLQALAIPLDLPSPFAAAWDSGQPILASLQQSKLGRLVAQSLARAPQSPCLVAPVAVRSRVVLLLYADRDGHDIVERDIAPLLLLIPEVGHAFARLIQARKGQSETVETANPRSKGTRGTERYPVVSTAARAPAPATTWTSKHRVPPPQAARKLEPAQPSRPVATSAAPATADPALQSAASPAASASARRDTLLDALKPTATAEAAPQTQLDTVPEAVHAAAPRSAPLAYSSSVIVDMGAAVRTAVQTLCHASRDEAETQVQAVLRLGDAALPMLAQDFPGELWFEQVRDSRPLPRGDDLSALTRALVAFGDTAVPYVMALLERSDSDHRFYATLVAGELLCADLVTPLGARLFDSDPEVAALAIATLRHARMFHTAFGALLRQVRITARSPGKSPQMQLKAIHALGALGDNKALGLLLQLLAEGDKEVARQAQHSLVTLTCHDFGSSQRRWQQWVDRHGTRARLEWLMDALVTTSEQLRSQAGEELQELTRQYFGFHPQLSKREREVIRNKYLAWWQQQG
ncbi:MAG: HEAT repeat domain-containing protein, partial [Polyangiales bacterium]